MSDLTDLPNHVEEPRAAERNRRAARAAFERRREPDGRNAARSAIDLMMPAALAAFVGVYLTWAFVSAAALLH